MARREGTRYPSLERKFTESEPNPKTQSGCLEGLRFPRVVNAARRRSVPLCCVPGPAARNGAQRQRRPRSSTSSSSSSSDSSRDEYGGAGQRTEAREVLQLVRHPTDP